MTAQPRPDHATPLRLVPRLRAAIYARVSDPKQESNYSLPSQEAAMRAYCAEQGYTLAEAHVYREVHTATDLWERPTLAEVRAALDRRELDVLVCYDPDRFSRKQVHSAVLQDICERAGAELKFAMFDFARDATGQFLLNARVFAAELEREKLIERTMRGARARILSGKPFGGGHPPYGYRWRDAARSGYDIDPVTAPIVRRMFDLAAGGTTLRRLAAILEAEGIPTPRGRRLWSHPSLGAILGNEAYTGVVRVNRIESRRVGGKIKHRRRPDAELVTLPEGTCPPLVDRATFDVVRAQQARNKANARRSSMAPERFLLRGGFVVCGYCGRCLPTRYGLDKGGRRYPLYVANRGPSHRFCGHSFAMSATQLDPAVWAKAEAILSDRRLIADQIARLRESDPTAGQLASIERQLAEIDRKQANLARQLGLFDDDEAGAPVRAEIAALGRQRKDLHEDRERATARREAWRAAQGRLDDLERWYDAVAENLPRGTLEQKREVLDIFGFRVELFERDRRPRRFEITTAIDLDDLLDGTPCRTSHRGKAGAPLVLRWGDEDATDAAD